MLGPFLVYTVLRLGLLVASVVVLGLLGIEGPLLLLVAILLSSVLSMWLLRRQRDAMVGPMADRLGGARRRFRENTSAEDD